MNEEVCGTKLFLKRFEEKVWNQYFTIYRGLFPRVAPIFKYKTSSSPLTLPLSPLVPLSLHSRLFGNVLVQIWPVWLGGLPEGDTIYFAVLPGDTATRKSCSAIRPSIHRLHFIWYRYRIGTQSVPWKISLWRTDKRTDECEFIG